MAPRKQKSSSRSRSKPRSEAAKQATALKQAATKEQTAIEERNEAQDEALAKEQAAAAAEVNADRVKDQAVNPAAVAQQSSRRRQSSSKKFDLSDHGFPPGAKVSVHENALESPRDDKAPYTKSLGKATVKNNGELSFSDLDPGHYVAAAEIEQPRAAQEPIKTWRYVEFHVGA